jgi:hypothetical protein
MLAVVRGRQMSAAAADRGGLATDEHVVCDLVETLGRSVVLRFLTARAEVSARAEGSLCRPHGVRTLDGGGARFNNFGEGDGRIGAPPERDSVDDAGESSEPEKAI